MKECSHIDIPLSCPVITGKEEILKAKRDLPSLDLMYSLCTAVS